MRRRHRLGVLVVTLTLLLVPGPSPAEEALFPAPGLTALIQECMRSNRELQSMRDQIRALEKEAPAAGAFHDPKVSLGLLNVPADTYSYNQEPMTQQRIALTQRLSWFGKLSLAEKRVVLKARSLGFALRSKELALARETAETYHDLGITAEELSANTRLSQVLALILRVAESRYATGRGGQQDVLQAQVEANQLLDERIDLDKKRRVKTDRINELLNRGDFAAVPPHNPPALLELELDRDGLVKLALENNPAVARQRTEIETAEIDVRLARKDFLPDLDVSVAWGKREEDNKKQERANFLSAGVSFTVPLWAPVKQYSKLKGAKERLSAAKRTLEGVRSGLPHRIDSALAEIESLRENHKLLNEALMLQASQWAEASLAAYETGQADFSAMLAAESRLVRYDLKLRTYHHRLRIALARLQELTGAPLPLRPAKEESPPPLIESLPLGYRLPGERP